MANRTSKDAKTVKGTNPQYIIEKIIRMRIYDSRFWKEECFALSAELMVDKSLELKYIGGIYGGNIKPTPFLCLILKMLQIQPEKDIVIEFIRQEDSKYLRALGAFYMRLTGATIDVFKYLEPLYNDYRKLRWMTREGKFEILHMDEFIDNLLREDRSCDIQLPRLQKRETLEDTQQLEPRVSALEEDLDNLSASSDEETDKKNIPSTSHKERSRQSPPVRRRSKSPVSSNRRRRSHSRDRDRRRRSRSRSKERRNKSPKSSSRRDKESKSDRSKKDNKKEKENSMEREIREQNELRAKLGLQPLR